VSGFSGTQTELLYSFAGTGTQLNTFTTEASLMGAYPACPIPGTALANAGMRSSSLKIKASGRLGGTTPPTFTWFIRLTTVQPPAWLIGGTLLGQTAAVTSGSVTLAPWFLDVDITLVTVAQGAASTVKTMGEVRGPLALATPFGVTIPANNTSPTIATIDITQQYFLWLSAACGTSVSTNLIQLESLKVYGEN